MTKQEHEQYKSRSRLNRKIEETLPESAGPSFSLIKEIERSPYYGKEVARNDKHAYEFIQEHLKPTGSGHIQPGQMLVFEYFEPKTKDELEYYDARPCTIFFNVINTNEGKRVLGFNIHYFPPKMRYQILNTIFNIYKPIYTKYFKDGTKTAMDAFDYKYLIESLQKAGLEFGVRMYIPNLIGKIYMIPPQMWSVAVFTEGWFKKQTRVAVLNHWRQWLKQHGQGGESKQKKGTQKSKIKQTK